MDIYSNFDEKKNFFNGNYIITDIKILKTKLDELSGPGLFFRGVDNASYKIYGNDIHVVPVNYREGAR